MSSILDGQMFSGRSTLATTGFVACPPPRRARCSSSTFRSNSRPLRLDQGFQFAVGHVLLAPKLLTSLGCRVVRKEPHPKQFHDPPSHERLGIEIAVGQRSGSLKTRSNTRYVNCARLFTSATPRIRAT